MKKNTGLFARMKQAVSRTRESLSSKIEGIAALTRTVDEQAFEDLESALLSSDLGVSTTTAILNALRDRALRKSIEGGDELRSLLKDQMIAILNAPQGAAAAPQCPQPRPKSRSSSASTAPAKPPPAASWPPGAAPKATPCSCAPRIHSAQPQSSSLKSGPPAPASR